MRSPEAPGAPWGRVANQTTALYQFPGVCPSQATRVVFAIFVISSELEVQPLIDMSLHSNRGDVTRDRGVNNNRAFALKRCTVQFFLCTGLDHFSSGGDPVLGGILDPGDVLARR